MKLHHWILFATLVPLFLANCAERPEPDEFSDPALPPHSDAAYAKHIGALEKQLPHDGFHIVIEKPFVVIGDESLETIRRRSKTTIRWATDLLKKSYFDRDPRILDIWLFKDKESYEKHVRELFGSRPRTPFGYYSSSDGVLVMNIATGGGTLVHEIVHPFVEANFPKCPAWFNEGLGSLYEQSREKNGEIWGLTNWRLERLQMAIRQDRVPTFEELCSTTTEEFYERDRGTNYAQARYLLYYLQDRGLLRRYYREFVEHHATDPTGYATLVRVLDEPDMAAFHEHWTTFVLALRYP